MALIQTNKKIVLVILTGATALGPMAINMLLPSLPGLQKQFSVELSVVQLALSLYLASLAVAQLIYGPLSDRFGRRKIMLGGICLFVIGSLVCVFASSIEMFLIGRVLQAVGGCSGMVVSRAIIRDLYEREQAASMLAYVTMAMVVAPMFSPALGGYLDVWFGWQASFLFMACFGVLVLGFTALFLPETHKPVLHLDTDIPISGLRELFREQTFYGYVLQLSFSTAVFFTFLGGAPYVIVDLMGSPKEIFGLYFIAVSLMYMLGNFAAARLSVRLGIDRMIFFGTLCSMTGGVTLLFCYFFDLLSPETLFLGMAFVALGNGSSLPNGIAGAISIAPQRAATAAGIAGFCQMAMGALASYVIGHMLTDSALPLVIMMVVSSLLAFTAHYFGILRVFSKPIHS